MAPSPSLKGRAGRYGLAAILGSLVGPKAYAILEVLFNSYCTSL